MKKTLLLLLFTSVVSFGQGLTISTEFTAEQLVNDILLSNSNMVSSNVSSNGSCGVGYFSSENPSFAFQEGIIIRSGNISSTAGEFNGNNLSSNCSNYSDLDLSAYNTSGQGQITDCSYLSFDFVAETDALSFNFIFASNEYGQFQCLFADVFAFILTNLETGTSQNIALVPNTFQPVSVTTIRNQLYNDGCPSVNPQFFQTYHTGSNPSALNMRGYTVPMQANATLVPNNSYRIKLVIGDYLDSLIDSAILIEAGSFGFDNDAVRLVSFIDSNNNGTKEASEMGFSMGNFVHEVNNSGEQTQIYSPNGNVLLNELGYENLNDFSFQIQPEYAEFFTNNSFYDDIEFFENEEINTLYFPIFNSAPYSDVSIFVSPFNNPVAGFTQTNHLIFTNNGSEYASGSITLEHSSNVTVANVVNASVQNIENGFSLDYFNLAPGETRTIVYNYQIPSIPEVALGDIVSTNVTINSNAETDIFPSNNQAYSNSYIIGSYDPNDIKEARGEEILFSEFGENDYLYYTIRFQNTGTANTSFVKILNEIPFELNKETIFMVEASHDYVLRRNNNQLEWFFENLILVPQSESETLSQGYLTFKIKPTVGYEIGTIIGNYADIYFDYNPPITTNLFQSVFVENFTLSNDNKSSDDFVVYPNPAQNSVTIINKDNQVISEVLIFDLLGKVIIKSSPELSTYILDVSSLKTGIYLLEVNSNNQKITKKIIKH
ncbi:MAG: DUF7619 domain-containing protein [Flavobacterium sp.]